MGPEEFVTETMKLIPPGSMTCDQVSAIMQHIENAAKTHAIATEVPYDQERIKPFLELARQELLKRVPGFWSLLLEDIP